MKKQAKPKKSKKRTLSLDIVPRDSLIIFRSSDPLALVAELRSLNEEARSRNISAVIFHSESDVDFYSFTDEELLACGLIRVAEAGITEH